MRQFSFHRLPAIVEIRLGRLSALRLALLSAVHQQNESNNAENRSMLWLKDAEDLDVKDLAEIFRMPEGTVKARLSRARNFVRNYLKNRKKGV